VFPCHHPCVPAAPRPGDLVFFAGTTTDDAPTTAATSAHPGPTTPAADLTQEQIKRRTVLGGLINEYQPAA
jgi:hypothetical protein